ncbi:MAG: glycosyltransferase family 4 protein [Syntrophorhabdaceae bacterium]|nr:glycosyltransferase family 4 protein [Syntrophorhabdaceae bacterium]
MDILFIHQNFPGQFRHLVNHFISAADNRVVGICQPQAPGIRDKQFSSVLKSVYRPHRKPSESVHPYLFKVEDAVLNGQGAARCLIDLKKKGFRPDVAFAHIGWGEALYFKDVFPDVPLIGHCEFYYHGNGADVGFDPEFPTTVDDRMRVRTWNMTQLLSLVSIDAGVSPTLWQRDRYPSEFHKKIEIIHEGIDTESIKPDIDQRLTLPDGATLTKDMEVITYTARGLEPYRGFHIFMKGAEEICRRRPRCHIVITGGDEVRYGKRLPDGISYREKLLQEAAIDHGRIHFMGLVPYETHIKTLQVSSAHVYLTIPFVLSWSMMEAMAAQCVIIGSATPPVEEVIEDGRNGLLCDFFSPQQIADRVDEVFNAPGRMHRLGETARRDIIERYNVNDKLAEYRKLWQGFLQQDRYYVKPLNGDNKE